VRSVPNASEFPRRFAEAAWRIGSTRGFGGLTVRALADELNVSVGLLYVHFEDKAALMLAVRRVAGERLAMQLDKQAEIDGAPSLATLCARYVAFVHEHLWIYENDHTPLGGAVEAPHRDVFLARARRQAREDVAEATWLHLWIAIHGLAMLTRHELGPRADGLVREHVAMWLRAVGANR
jgi:AcrR family transcriptional regulator